MRKAVDFIAEKIPFALTGTVATGINFGVYLLLVDRVLPPGPATLIAYSSSVIINFFLQRYFVFELRRSLRSAFALSMLVSLGGLLLDWLIVTGLHRVDWVGEREWVIKGIATGLVFFYNFYGKRRVFEGARPPDAGFARRAGEAVPGPEALTPPHTSPPPAADPSTPQAKTNV